jgi:hypothetical protein
MPHLDPEDRQLAAVVRRLLGEATDDAVGPLHGIADHMLSAVGPAAHVRPSARRYAHAIITAAAVEARLEVLAEQLSEYEWHRRHAEEVADRLISRYDLGDQVIVSGLEAEPPDDDVNGLIDLSDGRVWVRDETVYMGPENSKYWMRGESSTRGAVRYEWPLEGGPFLVLPDHWHLRHETRKARQRDELEDRLKSTLRSNLPHGTRYDLMAGVEQLLDLVLTGHNTRYLAIMRERDHARQQLADIRRIHSSPNTPVERHEQTMAVLARPLEPDQPPAAPDVPRCHRCGHQPHSEAGCLNMASDGDCDCREDSLGGPVYDGDSDRTL